MKYLILSLALVATDVNSRTVSTIVHNQTQDSIIIGDNMNVSRPIASLTKLMTAMVALDYYKNDLSKTIQTTGSNSLPAGSYTREQLLTALLVRSDNSAADAIAKDYPGGVKEFVRAMNRKAVNLNISNTKFADPSGLSSLNISNAGAVSIMTARACEYEFIKAVSTQKQVNIERRRKNIVLDNTNKPLLYDFDEILISKTGYTSASGWSVALVLEKNQQRFTVVVLGARSRDERYEITKRIIDQYLLILDRESQLARRNQDKNILEKLLDWITK